MLDGRAQHGPLFAEAGRQGMPAIAMTDHGNMFGAYSFWKASRETSVTPIIGVESYVAPGSRHHKSPVFWGAGRKTKADLADEGGKDVGGGGRYLHLTMLATGPTGLRNLIKLTSEAWLTGQYPAGKPRMDFELMAQHAEGIVVTTGCLGGGVLTRLKLGQEREALEYAATLRDIFGRDNVYAELMDHGIADERRLRPALVKVARELGLPFVTTNDSHYVREDEARAHDALLCVGTRRTLDDPDRFKFDGSGYYIKSAAEMYGTDSADEWAEGCRNTLLIAERVEPGCYDEVFASRNLMPEFPVPDGETQASWLRKEVARLIPTRYPSGASQSVRDRIEHELGIIERTGWAAYFLVVADICQYARRNKIALGPGRGSATGSMVMYILGVTGLDPIEHSLIFERFLNPDRVSPPDADLDFDEERREDMIRYVTEKYSDDRVAQIITFNKIKSRAAVRDAARVLGAPFKLGDVINKAMPKLRFGEDVSLANLFDNPEHERYAEGLALRELYDDDAEARRVIDTARSIEGVVRGHGVHAAGVILSSEPLMDVLPIHRRAADGAVIAGFPFTECEEIGLLKMDFLGLSNLTVISSAVANIKATQGIELDLEQTPFDDQPTFDLLARGDTIGVFQLDGAKIRQLLKSMKPSRFEDISAVLALYRPGPLAANAHIHFAERKTGRRPITPIHPELAEPLADILDETYGLVVYQEQVMAIAQRLAGYTLGQADILRRAMGKKKPEVLAAELERFTQGMASNGYSEAATRAIWDVLVPFSAYGFNKSHSAGYAVIAYWTAYLKANYPAEYMAALLTSNGDDKDKLAIYLAECRRIGLRVLPPDVNESAGSFTPSGGGVRFGLGAIRNVGEGAVEQIVATRRAEGAFTSFDDFLTKAPATLLNKRILAALITAGAFDSLGHTRRGLAERMDAAVAAVLARKKMDDLGQFDLFGDEEPEPDVRVKEADEWQRSYLLDQERAVLGRYVSGHPLDNAESVLARNRSTTVADLLAAEQHSGEVQLAGMLTSVERRTSRSGGRWALVALEDLTGSIEVVVYPKTYALHEHVLMEGGVVAVSARLVERDEAVSVIADAVAVLDVTAGLTPIVLTVPKRAVTPALVGDLKRILTEHPGGRAVHLRLTSNSRTDPVIDLVGYGVDGGPGFMGDVKALLGAGALGQLG